MDLNVATPFYHTFLGPYTVTSKFNVVLSGVQPYIMSSSDIQLYEQSLYNISTDFFSNYTTRTFKGSLIVPMGRLTLLTLF